MEEKLCWCGSGKAYGACHKNIDDKVALLRRSGKEVPTRDMIKTPEQIAGIRKACDINTEVLEEVARYIKVGMTTGEIDRIIYDFTLSKGATPADLGYYGFPKSVCTSVNDEVCHGMPSDNVVLKSGDIVNVDVSTIYNGYYGDASRMFMLGNVKKNAKDLVEVTKACLERGVAAAQPWGYLGDIGAAISSLAHKHGYSVVEEYGGHGVGVEFHEDPFVAHIGRKKTGMVLVPGMIFTIEPMINEGRRFIVDNDPNGWTVHTKDHSLSAQWEHTILITEHGPEILSY